MNHENLKIFSSSRIIYYPLEEKVNRSREELELRGKPFITQGKYEKLEGSRINIQAGQQRARLTYSSSVLIDKDLVYFTSRSSNTNLGKLWLQVQVIDVETTGSLLE